MSIDLHCSRKKEETLQSFFIATATHGYGEKRGNGGVTLRRHRYSSIPVKGSKEEEKREIKSRYQKRSSDRESFQNQ